MKLQNHWLEKTTDEIKLLRVLERVVVEHGLVFCLQSRKKSSIPAIGSGPIYAGGNSESSQTDLAAIVLRGETYPWS